ncbi:hypothetical protein D3C86_1350010 [compost metagenome]
MTNKITKEFLFTELSIKIATLEMKIDKVLELLSKPEITFEAPNITINAEHGFHLEGVVNMVREFNNTPPQWPNESRTDYLKRIGQYNEAQSEDEFYGETYK